MKRYVMNNKLIENKSLIEDAARDLWQGNGADIVTLNGILLEVSEDILDMANNLGDEDRLTTIDYIRQALLDFQRACDNRDDFMLADCLMYEWSEIITIYISEGIKG